MIFLDAAATTPVRPEVLQALIPVLAQVPGNPSSHHEWGDTARRLLEAARASVAADLGVRASEIIFTSGGTEGDNAAVKGIALAVRAADPARRRVLISAVEHPAVVESARFLERFAGFEVVVVPVDSRGVITRQALAERVDTETALVSIMAANNEVGTLQEVAALAEIAHAQGAYVHTDAVQAVGSMDVRPATLGVDAMTLAGHKLGSPKGNGVLFLKARTPWEPLIHGGGQQRDKRSGTDDVAGAVAFSTALRISLAEDHQAQRVARDAFIQEILDRIPDARLTGDPVNRAAGVASFVFPGHSGESILLELQARDVLSSSGSACAAGSSEPSAVLTAMGYDADTALGAVRFSFGVDVSTKDLQRAAQALVESLEELRGLSG